ncbi:unnamed protein product, partial [Owenia fusiformis]
CRERSQRCSSDGDCCRGLVCSNVTETCEPPITIDCSDAIDIVFAVDTSCSISSLDKDRIRTFMTEIARAFFLSPSIEDDGVQMGALTFNKGTQHVAYLSDVEDPGKLIQSIATMNLTEVGCSTHTYAALERMENLYFTSGRGDRPDAPNQVILLSDGVTKPDGKVQDTYDNADSLRATGAVILVVGLPQGCKPNKPNCVPQVIGQEEWMRISGASDNPDLMINILSADFTRLRDTVMQIGEKVCGKGSVRVLGAN